MRIACPKEIKPQEHRVGLTPESTAELVRAGHDVAI
jgi:alanine dehydrogenase